MENAKNFKIFKKGDFIFFLQFFNLITNRDYILIHTEFFPQITKWHHPGNPWYSFAEVLHQVSQHFLPFDIMSHSVFIIFYIISGWQFLPFHIISYSAFCIFNIISSQRFFPIDILSRLVLFYLYSYVLSSLFTIRHFVLSTFLPYNLFAVDLLSHLTFCTSTFFTVSVFTLTFCW